MFYDIRDQKIGCVPRVLCAVVSSEVYASTAFSSSQINQVSDRCDTNIDGEDNRMILWRQVCLLP